MIKVAHSINPYLFQTGNWIYNQINFSKNCRHIVLTTQKINLNQFPFDPIYSTEDLSMANQFFQKTYRKGFKKWLPYWFKVCQIEKIELLHSHFGNNGYQDIEFVKHLRIPHIVSFYGADMSKIPTTYPEWKSKYKKLFCHASIILAEGPFARKSIVDLGCPPDKVLVNRLGIDLANISFTPRKFRFGDELKVLIAATFTEKKGIPYALEAFALAQREYPNMSLTLIGDANKKKEQQGEKKKILSIINKYDIHDKVKLLGYIPYNKLINAAYEHHVFLSPSVTAKSGDIEGGSPVIITELLASGMPVVSTYHCDIPEVIIPGETGLLANERDTEKLVSHLKWLIEHSGEWIGMLEKGRAHVEKEFSSIQQGQKLENIYRKLIQ